MPAMQSGKNYYKQIHVNKKQIWCVIIKKEQSWDKNSMKNASKAVIESNNADFIAAATTDIYETNVLPTENLERSNGNPCNTENHGRLEAQVHESDSPNTLQFGSIKEGTRSSSPKEIPLTTAEKEPKSLKPGPSHQRPSTPPLQISTFKLHTPSAKDHADKMKGEKRGKPAILTESPCKNELLEAIKAAETIKAALSEKLYPAETKINQRANKNLNEINARNQTKKIVMMVLMWNVCIAGIYNSNPPKDGLLAGHAEDGHIVRVLGRMMMIKCVIIFVNIVKNCINCFYTKKLCLSVKMLNLCSKMLYF
ncbi:hypothetical protein JTB14_027704 [Gonioctena quinquepunctata]|nr:hypothetical protein JTB14_027704 [Gonioctena quinquepunctata]